MKRRVISIKYYTVHWISNGFCYRTTLDVPQSELKNMKKVAHVLGESLVVEFSHTEKIEY